MGAKDDHSDEPSFQDFTKKWIRSVDRGGLFLVKDEVYSL